MLTLFLIRGVPGSGKSSLAENMAIGLNLQHYEADDYFMQYNPSKRQQEYKFDALQLSDAHVWCQNHAQNALQNGESVVVSNTSTTEKEVEVYRKIAENTMLVLFRSLLKIVMVERIFTMFRKKRFSK